jgi:hypothetical protein
MPRDKTTLAWPSDAVADVLRDIPQEIDAVITEDDWEKRPKILDLDHWDRSKFDRMIAWYRLNTEPQKEKPTRPSITRKLLHQKVKDVRAWRDALSPLNNNADLLAARARPSAGESIIEKRSSAQAQVKNLQADLDKLAADLKAAAHDLPRGVRKTELKSEVLYHLIYVLHFYLRLVTGKGLSGRGSSKSDNAKRELAVWLCRIAVPDPDLLPRQTIITAIEKAIRSPMHDDDFLHLFEGSIASVLWHEYG